MKLTLLRFFILPVTLLHPPKTGRRHPLMSVLTLALGRKLREPKLLIPGRTFDVSSRLVLSVHFLIGHPPVNFPAFASRHKWPQGRGATIPRRTLTIPLPVAWTTAAARLLPWNLPYLLLASPLISLPFIIDPALTVINALTWLLWRTLSVRVIGLRLRAVHMLLWRPTPQLKC